MRNSGIPWVGDIPKDWEMYRIKYNTFLKGRIGWQGLNSNDFIDEGYCLITGTDFDNKGGINWHTCYRISKERFYEDVLLHVKNGDLLMTKDGTVGKMAYIKNLPEEASLNSHLLIIRQTTGRIDNGFLYWIMLSDVFKRFCSIYQSGSIMNSISQSTLGLFCSYCPSIIEQQKIASFLDRKCAEIDEMISLQEKIVAELKAYKQSVITEAVTKGLNPDVPMKDSGIEWIGEIPQHWNERRLKDCGYLYGGLSGKAGDDFNVDEERDNYALFIPFTNIFNNLYINPQTLYKVKVEEGECQNEVLKGDVLFLMSSEDYEGLGKTSLLNVDVSPLYLNSFCKGFRITKSDTNPRYLNYLLTSSPLRNLVMCMGNGFIRVNLRAEKLSKCPVLLPPLDEQVSIADYLDTKCTEIDNLISIKLSKIDSLKEYKKSIIYEYVTGKKEVIE